MNIPRLQHLITILNEVPQEKFNLAHWAESDSLPEPAQCELPDNFITIDCRTVLCAIGWAGLNKKCIADGFYVVASGEKSPRNSRGPSNNTHEQHGTIVYKGRYDFQAIIAYYDIGEETADKIFLADSYNEDEGKEITPFDVIERIQELITTGGL